MRNKNKNKKFNWLLINVAVLILLIGSFLSRLIFSNFAATQDYELSRYSVELKDLQRDYEQLTLSATDLQSIDRLLADSGRLNLVKVDQVYYLRLSGSVAINK